MDRWLLTHKGSRSTASAKSMEAKRFTLSLPGNFSGSTDSILRRTLSQRSLLQTIHRQSVRLVGFRAFVLAAKLVPPVSVDSQVMGLH